MVRAVRSFSIALALIGCGGGGGNGAPGQDAATAEEETECTPACEGRVCGDDGCGGSCGDCAEGQTCNPYLGLCVGCAVDCEGKACGDDGCGGSCGTCKDGLVCEGHACVPCVPSCAGKQCGPDGCGGSCGACPGTLSCVDGTCQEGPACDDGQKNGTESDVDCGGSCPGKCVVGQACKFGPDCKSKTCSGGVCGMAETCNNVQHDPGETDVDCGGDSCPGCPTGKNCKGPTDCLSLNCSYGVCEKPTCIDGSKNQDETDVDCGGGCDPCGDGSNCKKGSDCQSGICSSGKCTSCHDGKVNGQETDVDCGGPECDPCKNGKKCLHASDCAGEACENGFCCTANACGECTTTPEEVCDGKDNDCDGKTDEEPDIGKGNPCPEQNGVCKGSVHRCMNGKWTCDASVYAAFNKAYETTESLCDKKDNDCNGLTDEPQECCEPKCAGKECGPDGCGGLCGGCGDGFCFTDQCVARGKPKWSFKVDGYTITSTPAVAPDGTIFLTTDFPFELVAVSPAGKKKWSVKAAQDDTFGYHVVAPDGTVISRCSGGLKGYDASGKLVVTSSTELENFVLLPDGGIVGTRFNESQQFLLVAVDVSGATTKERFSVPLVSEGKWWFFFHPAVSKDGTIFVGAPDNKLYAVSSAGKSLWSTKALGDLDDGSLAIAPDGTVYVGTGDLLDGNGGPLYAIQPSNGSVKWTLDAGVKASSFPVVGPDNTVYVAVPGGVMAVTPDGKKKWLTQVGSPVYEPPAVTKHGIVLVGGYEKVVAINPDGEILWDFVRAVDSPMVLTPDGTAYFNYNTGSGSELWALDVDSGSGSPWPMWGHDPRLSGRYTDGNGTPP